MTAEDDEEYDNTRAREQAEARRQKILGESDERMDRVSGLNERSQSTMASKMAAARRRRFKKTAKTETQETEETPTEEKDEPETPVADASVAEETIEDNDVAKASVDDGTKTKYLGVAKMRRRLNKEKQKETETAVEEEEATKPAAESLTIPGKTIVNPLPILMHVVTVILLFLAGLDVGLQQPRFEHVAVYTDIAPRTQGLKIFSFGKSQPPKINKEIGRQLELDVDDEDYHHKATTDSIARLDTDEDDKIDPLFGVDLDALTQGPGLYFWMGRFAVKVHRMNLAVLYYFPLRVVNFFVTTFQQLLKVPPILCLSALVIRQLIGKTILGAKLPAKVVDAAEHVDIMSTVKKFITQFAMNTFPTAATIYDAWSHLRADIYVVLFGLLVGIAWNHSKQVVMDTAVGFEPPLAAVVDVEPVLIEDLLQPEDILVTDEL